MRRFLGLWLLLGLVQWVAVTLLDFAVLRAVDWRFEPFCEAVLIPAMSAAAVAAGISASGRSRRAAPMAAAAREKGLVLLALAGGAVLAAGWLADPRSRFSLSRPMGAPNLWFSLQVAAAAVLGAAVALRRTWTGRERTWLLLSSAFAFVASVRQALRWVGSFSDVSPFGRGPFLLALALELLFLGAAVGLAWKASSILARAHPLSGWLLETSTFFPVAAAAIVALSVFLRPRLTPPWSAVSGSLLLAGAPLVLGAAVLAWRARAPEKAA